MGLKCGRRCGNFDIRTRHVLQLTLNPSLESSGTDCLREIICSLVTSSWAVSLKKNFFVGDILTFSLGQQSSEEGLQVGSNSPLSPSASISYSSEHLPGAKTESTPKMDEDVSFKYLKIEE